MKQSGMIVAAVMMLAVTGACADAEPTPWEAAKDTARHAVDSGARPAVVLAYIDKGSVSYFGYGVEGLDDPDEVDENTVFGVGSLGKVFTGHLASAMIADGQIAPTALIEGSPRVELRQALTHRTDLPRDIPASILRDSRGDELSLLARDAAPSPDANYSSVGMLLSGQTLADAAGGAFADIQRAKVFEPLGMGSTTYDPSDSERLATPYIGSQQARDRPFTPPVAYPAGGLYSTAQDLTRFLQHYLAARPGGRTAVAIAARGWMGTPFGWKARPMGEGRILYHGGDGNGYQAFIGADRDRGRAVVLLINSSARDDLQAIAIHLLDESQPLPTFEAGGRRDQSRFADWTGAWVIAGDAASNIVELEFGPDGARYRETSTDGALVRETSLDQVDDREFRLPGIPASIILPATANESPVFRIEDDDHSLVRREAEAEATHRAPAWGSLGKGIQRQ